MGRMNLQSMERWNNLSIEEMRTLREIVSRIDRGDERISVRSFAEAAYVSTSSIVRLAKKLGLEGYSELLYVLKHERLGAGFRGAVDIYETLSFDEQTNATLDDLARALTSGQYGRVNVMGVGYSDLSATYLCNRLMEEGLFAANKSPLDFHDDTPFLSVFFSESGETRDLTFVQERLRAKGLDDYAFTAESSSTLGENASHRILVKRGRNGLPYDSNHFVINCLECIESLITRMDTMRKVQES